MSELSEQIALYEWCSTRQSVMPELRYLAHVPNGGYRSKKTASDLKRSGVRAGFPDLILPAARRGWHALFIELKTERSRVSVDQKRWHEWLREQGYYVEVCRTWEGAAKLLEWYLGVPAEKKTEFFT